MVFRGFNRDWMKKAVMLLALLGFVGWAVQLGGIAALQVACPDELHPELNNVDNMRAAIRDAKALATQLATTPTTSPLSNAIAARTFGASLTAMQALATRSIMSINTYTPDYTCSMIYRYQWYNTALNFFVLVLVALAVVFNLVSNARLALTAVLVYATVISTSNAHALITFEKFVPEKTHKAGTVFFLGCVAMAVVHLTISMVLGFRADSESGEGKQNAAASGSTSQTDTPVKKDVEAV